MFEIGCGGGLVCEPLARLGAEVTCIEFLDQQLNQALMRVSEEIERGTDATVVLRCVPLIDGGEVTGGLCMVRDISELRRRDRASTRRPRHEQGS